MFSALYTQRDIEISQDVLVYRLPTGRKIAAFRDHRWRRWVETRSMISLHITNQHPVGTILLVHEPTGITISFQDHLDLRTAYRALGRND